MRRIKSLAAGVVIATITSLFGMSVAPADQLVVDGDSLEPVSANTLAMGEVCAGSSVTKAVLLALVRETNGNPNIYRDGTSPIVSVVSTTSEALSALVPTTPAGSNSVTLTSSWSSQQQTTVSSDTATGQVTLAVPVASGPFAASVRFRATGTAMNGSTLVREADVTVTATVGSCDTTAPTLHLPSSVTTEATSAAGAAVTYPVSATDTAPASPAVTCTPASGSTFALGATTVSCSTTDAAGNTATGSFTVSVVDTTAPGISGTPADLTAAATGADGATISYANPTAVDVVDGSVPVGCSPPSPALVPLGSTTVTCTATDRADNTATTQFSVTVSDRDAPLLTVPKVIKTEATSAAGASVDFAVTASDAVDGDLPITCSKVSGDVFPLGATDVECSAVDGSGNRATASFLVDVVDTTAPALDLPEAAVAEATAADGATVAYHATATDLVDGDVEVFCSPASGSTFPLGSTVVSCSARDMRGTTATGSFTVAVVDSTPPALLVPADVIDEGDTVGGRVVSFSATALDAVDGILAVSCTHASGSLFPTGTTVVTCDVADVTGNVATGSFSVTVTDTTAPNVDVPEDMTVEAVDADGAVVAFSSSADDIVDGSTAPSCAPESGSTFPLGETEVICSAKDSAGNTGTGIFTVTVADTTPPTIGELSDVTAEAAGPDGATVEYRSPGAEDAVSGAVEVTCSPASGTAFDIGSSPVECSASDDVGNRASRMFTVTVSDTRGPVLSLPRDILEEATGPDGADVIFAPTASDAVDGSVAVDCEPHSGSTFSLGTTKVECSAADSRGNSSDGSFNLTVRDTTPPSIVVPDAIIAEAKGPDGASVTFDVAASDLVDGGVGVTCDASSGSTFSLGTTGVTCEATDAAGNGVTERFDVEVVDTTAPHVTVPADITVEATGPGGAVVTFAATAIDAVSGMPPTSCTPAPGATFTIGSTTVRCTATDGAGNTGEETFSIAVEDTTPPLVSVPADQVLEATSADGATATFSATATDVVDGAVDTDCAPAPGTFPLGTTTVTCTATDTAGNTGSAGFLVTVRDTTAPAIGDLVDVTLEATGPDGAVGIYETPTATDAADASPQVICTPPSRSVFQLGTNPVECSATDASGNTSTKAFTVAVSDTTEPSMTLPGDLVVEAAGPAGASVPFRATAHDLVDGSRPVVCTPGSGSTFRLGSSGVQCSAEDEHGNAAHGAFTVTVVDTTAPVVRVPADVFAEASGARGAVVDFRSSASDLVDGPMSPSCDRPTGSTFPLGTSTVTCSATDAAGNTGQASFSVTVRDTVAPSLTLPADDVWKATGATGAVVTFSSSATDAVDGTVPVACTPASGGTFALGAHSVSCAATDAAGNAGTGTFQVTVVLDLAAGIMQPVRQDVLNTVKAGSTVPLKWQVPNPDGGYLDDTAIVSGFKLFLVSCSLGEQGAAEQMTTTGQTQLRYDATANQFVQNWQTPKKAGSCYRAEIQFRGGQDLSANFQLR